MLGIHYFLVEARADAHEHFTKVAGEDADLLLDSMLLDPTAKSRDDAIALAKLVFLARIREYDPFSPAESALRIFGSDEISVDVFDRWWAIRDVEYESSFDTMVKVFLAPVSAKVKTHGDIRLAEMVEHRIHRAVSCDRGGADQ